jgi:hypothetical protein
MPAMSSWIRKLPEPGSRYAGGAARPTSSGNQDILTSSIVSG